MKLKPIIIAILEQLHIENKFVSLKFLINKLDNEIKHYSDDLN